MHAGIGPPPPGFRVVDELLPLPTAKRVHLLVPARSRAAATAALKQFVTGSGRSAQLMTAAAVGGSRTGLTSAVVRSRARISVADDTPADDLPSLVLSSYLAQLFGTDAVELAVRVGSDRPNGKPVVKVMTEAGEGLGFVKIGWNELTRAMVAREAEVLGQLTATPPSSFDPPAIVHAGQWQGFELMVVRAVLTDSAVPGSEPPIDAGREIAEIGGRTRSALTDTAWWRSVGERLAGVEHTTLGKSIATITERHGAQQLDMGGAHGDWTPWNMGRSDGRLVVWDWERFDTGVPVGIDLVHFAFMVALRQRHRSPAEAQAHVLATVPALLDQLDVAGALAPLMLQLHHVEMALRFAEARAQGVTTRHDLFAERLVEMVDHQ